VPSLAIPVACLVLFPGIDRFMSGVRSLTNFISSDVAVVVVSRWEGELDLAALHRELSG
jgi:aerobic C4-dicarboxylate transport protein